jgi:hypothetical protein
MNSKLAKRVAFFAAQTLLGLFVLLSGCQTDATCSDCPKATEPNLTQPVYILKAIDAAGGYEYWTAGRTISRNAVVTFYKPDGTFYLADQQYMIFPAADEIEISGSEKQGTYVWNFNHGLFTMDAPEVNVIPNSLNERDFSEAVLFITTIPIRLLEPAFEFNQMPEVKIVALWYYPIDVTSYGGQQWSKIVFYQNRDTSRVDMIWLACEGEQKFFMVRGYDYHKYSKSGMLIPSKVEIFCTAPDKTILDRLVKIDFK